MTDLIPTNALFVPIDGMFGPMYAGWQRLNSDSQRPCKQGSFFLINFIVGNLAFSHWLEFTFVWEHERNLTVSIGGLPLWYAVWSPDYVSTGVAMRFWAWSAQILNTVNPMLLQLGIITASNSSSLRSFTGPFNLGRSHMQNLHPIFKPFRGWGRKSSSGPQSKKHCYFTSSIWSPCWTW